MSYERMFAAACESLGEISVALGIPPEVAECADGNVEMLDAIAELQQTVIDLYSLLAHHGAVPDEKYHLVLAATALMNRFPPKTSSTQKEST